MIKNYLQYWEQRWNELHVSQRSVGLAIDSPQIKEVQCGAMVQVCQELQSQGRKDVGLLYKPTGNNYSLPDGTKIATDIMAIKETGPTGEVISDNYMVVDCIISGMSPGAKPSWQQQGMSTNAPNWILPPNSNPEPEPEPNPEPDTDVIKLLTEIRDLEKVNAQQNEIIISKLDSQSRSLSRLKPE